MDQRREFFRIPQPADFDHGQWLRRPRRRTQLQQSGDGAPYCAADGMAGHQGVRLQRPGANRGAALSKGRVRNFPGLVGDARRHQGQFEIRGRLRHAAVLARRRGRAAKHHHRRRHPVGAAGPAARRIQGRGEILRLSVEAGGSGRLAPEHRLSAGDPGGVRPDPRAGLLRPQSRVRRSRSNR